MKWRSLTLTFLKVGKIEFTPKGINYTLVKNAEPFTDESQIEENVVYSVSIPNIANSEKSAPPVELGIHEVPKQNTGLRPELGIIFVRHAKGVSLCFGQKAAGAIVLASRMHKMENPYPAVYDTYAALTLFGPSPPGGEEPL